MKKIRSQGLIPILLFVILFGLSSGQNQKFSLEASDPLEKDFLDLFNNRRERNDEEYQQTSSVSESLTDVKENALRRKRRVFGRSNPESAAQDHMMMMFQNALTMVQIEDILKRAEDSELFGLPNKNQIRPEPKSNFAPIITQNGLIENTPATPTFRPNPSTPTFRQRQPAFQFVKTRPPIKKIKPKLSDRPRTRNFITPVRSLPLIQPPTTTVRTVRPITRDRGLTTVPRTLGTLNTRQRRPPFSRRRPTKTFKPSPKIVNTGFVPTTQTFSRPAPVTTPSPPRRVIIQKRIRPLSSPKPSPIAIIPRVPVQPFITSNDISFEENENRKGKTLNGSPAITTNEELISLFLSGTNFQCRDQEYPGLYADLDTNCQTFHMCQAGGRQNTFVCPVGTLFDQRFLVCNWWNKVNCPDSIQLYSVNKKLYVTPERNDVRFSK